jgi:hypothetical protein
MGKDIKKIIVHNRRYEKQRRAKIFDILGRKCVSCGFLDIRALQIDHINGGGSKEGKKKGYNSFILLRCVSENPLGYQVLCANCNWIKRSTHNENKRKNPY